ncbi:MAG: glycosyltransferase, partial [Acidimicrobiales bacterium]
VDGGTLVSAVASSQATLLPYSYATQSGAVALAQSLGSVVVSTAVGGIGEQVEDGITGRLLPIDAPVAAWRRALEELSDEGARTAISRKAGDKMAADDRAFRRSVREVAA